MPEGSWWKEAATALVGLGLGTTAEDAALADGDLGRAPAAAGQAHRDRTRFERHDGAGRLPTSRDHTWHQPEHVDFDSLSNRE
jgi:hypothetical protein